MLSTSSSSSSSSDEESMILSLVALLSSISSMSSSISTSWRAREDLALGGGGLQAAISYCDNGVCESKAYFREPRALGFGVGTRSSSSSSSSSPPPSSSSSSSSELIWIGFLNAACVARFDFSALRTRSINIMPRRSILNTHAFRLGIARVATGVADGDRLDVSSSSEESSSDVDRRRLLRLSLSTTRTTRNTTPRTLIYFSAMVEEYGPRMSPRSS